MVKTVKTPPIGDNPLLSLNEEVLEHIRKMGPEFAEAEKYMEMFEELGVDQSMLREKLEWAKKAQKLILEKFDK